MDTQPRTYRDLDTAFKEAVETLRATCTHDDVSDWMEEYWAAGHSTCCSIKVCALCEVVVERRGTHTVFTESSHGDDVKEIGKILGIHGEFEEIKPEPFHYKMYGDERDEGYREE